MAAPEGQGLDVSLLTPSQRLLQAPAAALVAPARSGQVTILPLHAPYVTELGAGVVALQGGAEPTEYFVAGGLLEVDHDRVVVLAEEAEPVAAIDPAQAQAELTAVETKLRAPGLDAADSDRLLAAASRARERLQATRPRA